MGRQMHNLGRLVSLYGVSPAHLQRAVFVAILSFLFFLAMMAAFYIRQNFGYFLLSTAFLLVYLLTLFSWVTQRRSVLEVFEKGIVFKKNIAAWDDVAEITESGVILLKDKRKIALPKILNDLNGAIALIRSRIIV